MTPHPANPVHPVRTPWPTVRLGEVLRHRKEWITIDDLTNYKRPRVQLHVQGIVVRDEVPGALIKTKTQQVCRTGEFLVAEIDAKVGGFGIVPESLDGSIVSGHYFLFVIDGAKLDRRFLDYFIRTPAFREQVAAQGSTNYAAIRPAHVLGYEMPLPPLVEQRRVVARIEELSAQIHEARTLHLQASEEADALLVAMAHRGDLDRSAKECAGWKRRRLSDVIQFVDDAHKVAPDRSYPNLGIYSFGRGLFHKPPIDGLTTSATTLRRVKVGQFIYSRLFAFEGAYGRVTPEFDGAFVSQEYPTFDCDSRQIRSDFLAAYFKPAHLWKAVAAGSKGLGDRRQRVQPAQVLAHELWLPPIEWQNRLAEVQAEVDALKRLQAETAAELDALLPAILDRAFKGEL
ncbi:MAG: restriction endonuclease subunit S [Verrucomicrobia bacterium]|nr:restriction endonuclease subunit S [Verrucomicrobiota bacterium]